MSKLYSHLIGAQSGDTGPDRATIEDWLVRTLAATLSLESAELDIQEPLKSYGLASVDAIGLSGDLEDWLGREISPTLVYDYPTVEQLARYLAGETPASITEMVEPSRQHTNTAEPVAIIGMACRFPGEASSPAAFWDLLRRGADARTEIPAERWSIDEFYNPDPNAPGKMYTRYGCLLPTIERFDADFFGLSPHETTRMDPQQRLLLEVAWEALENAGLAASTLAKSQTGVFLGMMQNHEYAQLQIQQGDKTYLDDPYFGIGSAASIASGRLPYLLDLHGPALAIDTACSSSLVATHLACQSLRQNESQLALVGGVNMVLLPENMVNACKMQMLAPDGRCKTFDASADGFVMGEGCGFVVLKRLSEAEADHDTILAVIRGSAVNQDGRSNGMTAPNRLAQETVIRQALHNAGVAPDEVSYVEAHGSGTPLGDPIEIEALHNVLGQHRRPEEYLLVGSVKTNIGHLAGAAGIAGLIKTVLALQNREIPAHLHLTTPNPHISWQKQSVTIPTSTIPWQSERTTRIAGVSSFGWSGTNAHIVLEEAPTRQASINETVPTHTRPWHLFPLSARTKTALNSAVANLRTHLQEQPALSLADVAYTLQSGRNAFEHRQVFLARTHADVLEQLQEHKQEQVPRRPQTRRDQPVAFLFPGTGEQYLGLAQELYQQEATFREIIDECCTHLQTSAHLDLRQLLFNSHKQPVKNGPAKANDLNLRALLAGNGNGRNGNGHSHTPDVTNNESLQEKIRQTDIAQPAIFVIEYALARLLMEWGLSPQAMLGYSLGEYVAACLAGVFSLEDALALVARRAQLIQAQQNGAMLAVMLSEEAALEFVNERVGLAIINAPRTCVLAGPEEALAETRQVLTRRDIAFQQVETTHAFHSSMLAPIQAELTALAQTIQLNIPAIPYISNVTGTWITPEQATNPAYWAEHMCQTVRFADGVAAVLQETEYLLVEVGPGQALGSFVRQHPFCDRERMQRIFATLPSAREHRQGQSEQVALLTTLGKFWLAGGTIDWNAFHKDELRQRVSLPTYPFERQSYWPELRPSQSTPVTSANPSSVAVESEGKRPKNDWFYQPIWKQAAGIRHISEGTALTQQECWLVLVDNYGVGSSIITNLRQQNQHVIAVMPGAAFSQQSQENYSLRPAERSDYAALFKELRTRGLTIKRILHLWTLTGPDLTQSATTQELLQYGFYSLLALSQALGDQGSAACEINIVTNDLLDVTGNEHLQPDKATLLGPCRVIPQEYPHLTCRIIDISLEEMSGHEQKDSRIKQLLPELITRSTGEVAALRGNRYWEQTFEQVSLPEQTSGIALRERGVYLITGGLGGIGLALAEHLVRSKNARLILVGRTALPDRSRWNELLHQDETGESTQQIRQLLALEALGAEMLICSADVCNEQTMREVVQQAIARFGVLHGCFHAAGVPGNGLIQFKTPERAAHVLEPKVQGTLTLERVLRDVELDFLVLFSSTTAVTGSPGQVDYCAANAFLDAYASNQRKSSDRVISLNWSEWQWNAWGESVANFGELGNFLRENRRRYGLTFAEGMEALERALSCRQAQLLISAQALDQLIHLSKSLSQAGLWQEKDQEQQSKTKHPRPELASSYVAPGNTMERQIAKIWEELLGFEQIGIQDNFFDLGGNSLIGINLISRLRTMFNIEDLPTYILFEAPSISAMASHLSLSRKQPITSDDKTRERSNKRRESLKQRMHEPRKTR